METDQNKTLQRIFEITRGLGRMTDLDTYLTTVLSAAAELTGSESASLMEYDEDTRSLRFRHVPWFHRDMIAPERIPLENSAAGWIFNNVQPLIIADTRADSRHYSRIDEVANFTTRSLLGVPLLLHGRPVGVFEVFNKPEGNYTGEDTALLETLAALATTALQLGTLEDNAVSAQHEAMELDRLKSEFIAITSHELRTPLGLILGHATFLRELVGDEHAEQVDVIIRNASRLKEIIESLSNVDNHQTGAARLRQRGMSMRRVIEDTARSFHEMADEKKVRLETSTPEGDDLYMEADPAKIGIILGNLVKNAITFTNNGGHVTLRGDRQDGMIKVSVEDNGVGVPLRDLPHIFDRFYQVESHLTRRHGGMGLGLSVAKGMVEMHGGQIWAESMEGVGSTFNILLPVEPPTP